MVSSSSSWVGNSCSFDYYDRRVSLPLIDDVLHNLWTKCLEENGMMPSMMGPHDVEMMIMLTTKMRRKMNAKNRDAVSEARCRLVVTIEVDKIRWTTPDQSPFSVLPSLPRFASFRCKDSKIQKRKKKAYV
jgi:hypothetical protein